MKALGCKNSIANTTTSWTTTGWVNCRLLVQSYTGIHTLFVIVLRKSKQRCRSEMLFRMYTYVCANIFTPNRLVYFDTRAYRAKTTVHVATIFLLVRCYILQLSGRSVVTGFLPSPSPFLLSIFNAKRVRDSQKLTGGSPSIAGKCCQKIKSHNPLGLEHITSRGHENRLAH